MSEEDDSRLALAEITLARLDAMLEIELEVGDAIDVKAVGLATADVAALTIIVVFHDSVPVWWLSSILMGAAGVFLFLVLRQRQWRYAPDLTKFWVENVGKPRVEIVEGMLASLSESREHNVPFLVFKAKWFRWGYLTLAAGLVALLASALYRYR